jgi:hypothetical protein
MPTFEIDNLLPDPASCRQEERTTDPVCFFWSHLSQIPNAGIIDDARLGSTEACVAASHRNMNPNALGSCTLVPFLHRFRAAGILSGLAVFRTCLAR